jgi:hypothetical protein
VLSLGGFVVEMAIIAGAMAAVAAGAGVARRGRRSGTVPTERTF